MGQAAEYQDEDGSQLVWYAAYGSNLLASRLAHYLEGGRAPGASRDHRGARDGSPPRTTRPTTLDHELYFAGTSRLFGGGIAFIDPTRSGTTHARCYLITHDQFEDLVAQENGRDTTAIDLSAMAVGNAHALGEGRYETIVHCGEVDAIPAFTFTSAPGRREHSSAPSESYLSLIVAGLEETHRLGDRGTVDYLYSHPTVRLGWSRPELVDLVRRVREMHT